MCADCRNCPTTFRSRGGGPVGHPQGVQGKTLIFDIKYLPQASHIEITLGNSNLDFSFGRFGAAFRPFLGPGPLRTAQAPLFDEAWVGRFVGTKIRLSSKGPENF